MFKMKSLIIVSLVLTMSTFGSILYANIVPNIMKVNDAIMTFDDILYLASKEHGIIYSSKDMNCANYTKTYFKERLMVNPILLNIIGYHLRVIFFLKWIGCGK